MADIAWTAYALAMFTPEQLAAAVNARPDDDQGTLRPLPPPPATPFATSQPGGRVIIDGMSYDPNTPQQLQFIMSRGWRYEGGRWIAPGGLGVAATPDQDPSRPPGLSSVIASASSFASGSVLGTVIPVAPPVLLPQWVGGRVGVVRMGGGMRPESGGNPDRVRFGDPSVLPVVRMEGAGAGSGGGGGGGASW